jgi:hypothetical protein
VPLDSPIVEEVASLMSGYPGWWALAGGWATDLWLERITRDHHDIEVSCLRAEAVGLWDFLTATDAELFQLDPPGSGWRPWGRDDPVLPPSFQLQARIGEVTLDVFLETVDGTDWIFRRHAEVVRPLDAVAWSSSDMHVIRPEVQLLYMAKSTDMKNERDFRLVAPTLDGAARQWLRRALTIAHPGHRWQQLLS